MLRHSVRMRLLLPVMALVLAVAMALTAILAITEAYRVKFEASGLIERQSASLQTLFAVTRSMMLDRVNSSMRQLRKEASAQGVASVGSQVRVADRYANDLLLGQKAQANVFGMLDDITAIHEGTATLFSLTGDDFVGISTNVKKDDGSRAIGIVLDPNGQAAAKLRNGESFYGVVDILGNTYVTGYEPIFAGNDKRVIGAWYVSYKADTQPLANVVSSRRVLDSGFIAVFDSKNKLRFQSTTGATTDAATIERIVKKSPDDWVVIKQEVPDWGFTLVSAYPKSDVNGVIVRQSLWIAGIGLLVCALLFGMQWALIWNRVLRPIQHLTTVAEELSLGKWNHTIAEVDFKDEIGTLARAISRLSNSVRLAMERLSKR
ncbi:Cache 3/Cache 2 fusion domain-containing protein [Xanthomonas fragariae]|uniref:Cache 3/Cache 2 fusion domain-containing protein n=1 Tax=Xanthomonas fragariae TaxID=48664 RepID=UPI000A35C6E1|nr:Cache 3/Cache 2 fusion domain-containing protein [Xanthomonas fragariae]SMQ95483.1 methyl-accepting chemotaxis protein [Xanthomonas fragariae]